MCLKNAFCLSHYCVFPFGASEVSELIFILLILSGLIFSRVYLFYMCIYICTRTMVWYGGQRVVCGCQFSIMWVPGIELR